MGLNFKTSHEKIDFPTGIGSGKGNNPENTPAEVREKRSKKRGLILLYPLFGKTVSDNDLPDGSKPEMYGMDEHFVFGCAISFSGSSGPANFVDYVFNDVATQLELFE